jgi:hypothetical protein
MKDNRGMGLIDRIFKGGKERDGEPGVRASTQFAESEPDAQDSQAQRNAPRRELIQVVLRDTMRKHGIPSDWIDCRILSAITRTGRGGIHVNFVARQAHEQLLPYVFAFQESFQRELTNFEPRCRDWLLSVGWEFAGVKSTDLSASRPAPATAHVAGSGSGVDTVPAPLRRLDLPGQEVTEHEDAPDSQDDVEQDLQALFAIRDAALADAARRPAREPGPDFEPTQPFDETGKPIR